MVAAPWTIVSPLGEIHVVKSEGELKSLAKANGLVDKSYKNQLRALVGVGIEKPIRSLPLHRNGWQLLERVCWLVHVESGLWAPIIGGDGQLFMSNFKSWCNINLPGLEGGRLNEFMNKGWYWSNGQEQQVLCSAWRRAEAPPSHAEEEITSFLFRAAAGQGAGPFSSATLDGLHDGAPSRPSSSSATGAHGVCRIPSAPHAREREPCTLFDPDPTPWRRELTDRRSISHCP